VVAFFPSAAAESGRTAVAEAAIAGEKRSGKMMPEAEKKAPRRQEGEVREAWDGEASDTGR
jgi:hypothetical protein